MAKSDLLLLDSGVLLLWEIGRIDAGLIPSFKRTRRFAAEHYQYLEGRYREARFVITAPTATETVNLLGNRFDWIDRTAKEFDGFEEKSVSVRHALRDEAIKWLGFSDCHCLQVASRDQIELITADARLHAESLRRGQACTNLFHAVKFNL
ncbi:MAG: hypothetical protein AAF586_05435 [Planctomycetota bacterium]